ncbi:TPA: hypothetical protein IAA87_05480 [Candidatus Avigastranaerophilus faecigallinarum]|nr:hypothetical protein [Candidatus Avigastranaerophilus faecigallinarum]
MLKTIILILFLLVFSQNVVFSYDEEYIPKSEFKKAYIEYNKSLNDKPDALDFFNMCKVVYYLNDSKLAKSYCNIALNKIDEQKNPDMALRSDILTFMGILYSSTYRNNDITFDYYKQAIKIKDTLMNPDEYELANLYMNLGYAYFNTNLTDYAFNYYNKVLKIAEIKNEDRFYLLLADTYNKLSLLEEKNKDVIKQKEYLEKSLVEIEKPNIYINHLLKAKIYLNLAKYYDNIEKDKTKARNYYKKYVIENAFFPDNKILNISDFDSLSLEECKKKLNEYPYDIYTNIIMGYLNIGINDDLSEKYFNKAISINPENPYIYIAIAQAYLNKYKVTNNKLYLLNIKNNMKQAEGRAYFSEDIYFKLLNISLHINSNGMAKKYMKEYKKCKQE